MKIIRVIFAFTAMLVGGGNAMAIEEAKYTVVEKEDNIWGQSKNYPEFLL